jgi:hypothetical protein
VTRRFSPWRTVAFLLSAASLAGCAQNIVLEDQIDGGTSGTNDGSSNDGHCLGGQPQTLPFKTLSPEVIVALDRSSMMAAALSTTLTALVPEVQNRQNVVRFGFIDFPDDLTTCQDTCCVGALTPPPQTPASSTGFEQVAYMCNIAGTGGLSCPTTGSRPTEAALRSSVAYYQNDPQSYGRYVLLLTDGEPSGNAEPNGSCGDAKGDCPDAESEVGMLHSLNVQTIIVDLGPQSNANDCLHELATGQGTNGAPYYYFPGGAGLNDDLTTIVDMIAGAACHLQLTTPPGDPSQVSITYYGTPIPRDPGDGWSFDRGSSVGITLNGAACQSFINSRSYPLGLEVSSGCSTGHGGQAGP